jgi:hypoxanthine phosphoribosyltransferase
MEGIRTLISEAEIVARVEALAAEIAQKTPDDFVIVALLKGAAVFVADLVRALYRVGARPEIEFMRLSSYGLAKVSSGEVHLLGDVPTDLAGRRVLLVDDIVDTGRSIACAAALLHQRGIGNLLTCASRQAGAPRGQGQDRFCRLLYRRRVRGRLRHRLRGEIPLLALYRCRGGIKARPLRVMGCDSFATPAGSHGCPVQLFAAAMRRRRRHLHNRWPSLAGLVPAIHAFPAVGRAAFKDVGGRNKSGKGDLGLHRSHYKQPVSLNRS